MPVLAALILGIFNKGFNFFVVHLGFKFATRITVAASLGAGYVALLVLFNSTIVPFLNALFNTSYGTVIGLAFPPISGTVVTGLALLWSAKLAHSYFNRMASFVVR